MELYLTISVFLALCALGGAMPAEPVCSSFDFQFKTLETMLRTEQNVEKLNDDTRSKLESIEESLKKFKLELTTEFDQLKAETAKQLSEKQEKLNLLTTQAEERLQSVDNAVTAMKNRDLAIAFSVYGPTKSFVNGVPTFSKTNTNIGGAYNMATGLFTSPVDGLYMFVFTVQSYGKYHVHCYIKHNGDRKAFAKTNDDNQYTSASTSVYLDVTKGDTVTLGSCYGWGNVNNIHSYATQFSGALITQNNAN